VTEESHRDAMNDAIRAQRERGNVPKSMLPGDEEPAPEPETTPEPVPPAAPEPRAPEPETAPEPVPPAAPEPMTPEPETTPEPAAKRGFLARFLGR
jgi:hypothetical protein